MDSNSQLTDQHDKGFIDDQSLASLNQPQAPVDQDGQWKKLMAEGQDPYFNIDNMFIIHESGGEQLDAFFNQAVAHRQTVDAARQAANRPKVS
jgi:hypothetical protein